MQLLFHVFIFGHIWKLEINSKRMSDDVLAEHFLGGEALLTHLAGEFGVLPGPPPHHPPGTGRHVPRQLLLDLEVLLADGPGEHVSHMNLLIHLDIKAFSTLVTNIWGPVHACTACDPSGTGWFSGTSHRCCSCEWGSC